MRRGIAAVVVGLGLAIATSVATAAPGSCGHELVPPPHGGMVWGSSQVSASGIACGRARSLVHAWDQALVAGRIPDSIVAPSNRQHEVILGRYGRRYRFDGYSCRWMALEIPHNAYLGGRGRCRAGQATVGWSYQVAINPSVGKVTGCARGVGFRNGDASTIRVRGISCPQARSVLADALNHGVIGPVGGKLEVVHRVRHGFTYRATATGFAARRGKAQITFGLCWFNVTC